MQEPPLRGSDDGMAWLGLCSALALASVVAATRANAVWLVWHASAWTHHPWMLWTASLVHLSQLQLLMNLGALLVLAILGSFLQARWPATLAVLLAWPLGTLALIWWPQVHYAIGLSGLLMTMLSVLAVHAWREGSRPAALLLFVLIAIRLAAEQAWAHPLAFDPIWGSNVVNAAHLTGALAGAATALLVRVVLSLRAALTPRA